MQPLWDAGWWRLTIVNIKLPYEPAIPLLSIYPKELKAWIQTDICTSMFLLALFTRAKKWKRPKCPLLDKSINKMWFIHTGEYYLALKRKETLTCYSMDEDIILGEISQTRKDKSYMIPVIGGTSNGQICGDSRIMVARAGEGGERQLLFNRYSISFWESEEVLDMDGGDACTAV